jgi:hydrogenase maturation factor
MPSIPGKIIEITDKEITIDYSNSEKLKVNVNMVEDLLIGDYVIVSNKIIIAKIPKDRAKKFLDLIK